MADFFQNGEIVTLKSASSGTARDFISRYAMDASLNGLKYDRHEETQLVEAFVKSIMHAGQELLENPFESSLIPYWGRVIDAKPNILEMLQESIEKVNKIN
jgi:glucosyl-3-phosphoglycerate synthase